GPCALPGLWGSWRVSSEGHMGRTRRRAFAGSVLALAVALALATVATADVAAQRPAAAAQRPPVRGLRPPVGTQHPPGPGRATVPDRNDIPHLAERPVPDPLRHVANEVLVRLKPGVSPEAAHRALTTVPVAASRRLSLVDGLYHVKLASGIDLHQALRSLSG